MKIVYVIDSLASKGGAERILCDKMNYMVNHFGYEVYVITCYQDVTHNHNVYSLSEKVTQINLNIPYYSQYNTRYPKRLWVKYQIFRRLRRELADTVSRMDPDILVGLGYFKADLVTGIKCRARKIIESHEARIFTMSDHGLSRSFLSRLFMRFYKQYYFHRVERQADVVITLTNGDAQEWKCAHRVEVIPNFTMMEVMHPSTCDSKRVIAVGRLEWQKGFDRLMEVWQKVEAVYPDWELSIYGSGTLKDALFHQIQELSLHQVTIHDFTSSIAEAYTQNSIFVLSSRFEGFGLVLIEAMKAGLPCIAFDCPFGPSDVIVDGECGYLVPDGDINLMADRLCRLIEDYDLRQQFSQRAQIRTKVFDVDVVMHQWKTLIEGL